MFFLTFSGSVNANLLNELATGMALKYSLCATGVLLFGFIHMACWVTTSDRQIARIRDLAFHNILRQDMAYFDTHASGGVVSSMTEYAKYIAEYAKYIADYAKYIAEYAKYIAVLL